MSDILKFEGKKEEPAAAVNIAYGTDVRIFRIAKASRSKVAIQQNQIVIEDTVELVLDKHPVDFIKELKETYEREGLAPVIARTLQSIRTPDEPSNDGASGEEPSN